MNITVIYLSDNKTSVDNDLCIEGLKKKNYSKMPQNDHCN